MKDVILINFGGPRNREEVYPFLKNIFHDVLPRPLKFVAPLLAKFRHKKSLKMYDAIGGRSPVLDWTIRQAVLLQKKLDQLGATSPSPSLKGGEYLVSIGMKYGHPSIDGHASNKESIFVPLFPYKNLSTQAPKHLSTKALKHQSTSAFYNHPLYIKTVTEIIRSALQDNNTHILFTAHAVPMSQSEPYVSQIKESIELVMKSFSGLSHSLAFQSQYGPVRWTGPNVKNVLKKFANFNLPIPPLEKGGEGGILIVPLGFACENLETLYEIDKIYLPFARKLGLKISRTQALNDHPVFIDLLRDLVLDAAEKCNN